ATWQFTLPPSLNMSSVARGFFRFSFVGRDQAPLALSTKHVQVWMNGRVVVSDLVASEGELLDVHFRKTDDRIDSLTLSVTILNSTDAAGVDWLGVDSVELHLLKK